MPGGLHARLVHAFLVLLCSFGTNRVSAWQAERESRPTRSTRATSSRGCVGDDVTRMLRGNCCFRGILP